MRPLRICIGDRSMALNPQAGGHWIVYLQYLLGLQALGHDVFLMELLKSTGDARTDEGHVTEFYRRLESFDLKQQCFVLVYNAWPPDIDSATVYGKTRAEALELIKSADMLWNLCCHVREPLLSLFRHRVLLDLDPGHLQLSATAVTMDIDTHDTFLTVGQKINDPDSDIPQLGKAWHAVKPFVYLPIWPVEPDPGAAAPMTSVTHWGWGGELSWRGRLISISKRDAYLRYLDLPVLVRRAFELAANIHPDDHTGDRELLGRHGWRLINPWEAVASPGSYQGYLAASRAEILCPKPVYRELKTGWVSDRSLGYLASGRPVITEDTGLSDHLPMGEGFLTFQDMPGAVAAVEEIDGNYQRHSAAARKFAEEHFDSSRCLTAMIAACN